MLAMNNALKVVNQRTLKPWIWHDLTFKMTKMKRELQANLKIYSDVIAGLIAKKKKELLSEAANNFYEPECKIGYKVGPVLA